MKKCKPFIIIIIILLLTSCSWFGEKSPDQLGSTSIEEDLAFLTSEQCQGRLVGTEGNKTAANWIEQRYIDLGLSTYGDSYRQEFEVQSYNPDKQDVAIEVTYADGTVEKLVLGRDYAPCLYTRAFSYEGEISFSDESKDGGIYVSKAGDDMSPPENSIANWIVGTRISSKVQGSKPRHIIVITDETYDRLKKQNAVYARATEKFAVEYVKAANTIGVLQGKNRDSCIVISAHYDHIGWWGDTFYPGALDNASGVAAMLNIAKQLKDSEPYCDIIFAAFDAEECGLYGSAYFVNSIMDSYEQIVNINLDMLGGAPLSEGLTLSGSNESFADLVKSKMDSINLDTKIHSISTSDHASFQDKGFPAVMIGDYLDFSINDTNPWNIHSSTDTVERLNIETITMVSNQLSTFISTNTISLLSNYERADSGQLIENLNEHPYMVTFLVKFIEPSEIEKRVIAYDKDGIVIYKDDESVYAEYISDDELIACRAVNKNMSVEELVEFIKQTNFYENAPDMAKTAAERFKEMEQEAVGAGA